MDHLSSCPLWERFLSVDVCEGLRFNYLFASISGDFNPMHVSEEFAKQTPFKTRIAHGALPQSLIARVLGTMLPGLGTVAMEVKCRFKAPTFFGDTVTATARVAEKIEDKRWVRMVLT